MNISNGIITEKSIEKKLFVTENYNSDFMLPDYLGNISKIIRCSVDPGVESTFISDNKININGELHITLLYVTDENILQSYENTIKYSKYVTADNIDSNVCVFIDQEVVSENFRALGPKRINVNGIIEIKAVYDMISKTEYIDDIKSLGIQLKRAEKGIFTITHRSDRTIKLCEQINTHNKISFILHKEIFVEITETKTIKDKTHISGRYRLSILYIDDNGDIKTFENILPFTEIIDTYSSLDEDDCFIGNIKTNLNLSIDKNTADNNIIDIKTDIFFSVSCGHYNKISLLEDAYSLENDLEIKREEVSFIERVSLKNQTFKVNITPDLFNNEIVNEVYLNKMRFAFEHKEDKTKLLFDCNCCSLSVSEGHYKVNERRYAADGFLISEDTNNYYELKSIMVSSPKPLRGTDYSGGAVFEISVDYFEFNICKAEVFTNIEDCKEALSDKASKMVVYFAHENECLWDIAKENRTTVDALKNINGLENDTICSSTMLVFPVF